MAAREPSRLADLVRQHRTAAALSQEALAERAGLSVRAISDLERGVHRTPRLETVRLVAGALGLNEADRADLLTAGRPHALAPVYAGRGGRLALLPLPPTRLIGRETERAVLAGLLTQDDVPLLTLTGPGGTGKTRLALAVASDAQGRYRDGVYFVDLSPLRDPGLVIPTIATAVGVHQIIGESFRETLSRSLHDRQLLLVLDNFEHLLRAAPVVAGSHHPLCPSHDARHEPGATAFARRARVPGAAARVAASPASSLTRAAFPVRGRAALRRPRTRRRAGLHPQ